MTIGRRLPLMSVVGPDIPERSSLVAPPRKGPPIKGQYEDQAQYEAVKRAAQEDGIAQIEMVRRLIAYGLVMREKNRTEAIDPSDPIKGTGE
jgi:hypothetical protein